MKPEDFDLFSTLVKQRSGLVLTKDKAYLLESRLTPVARKWNLKTIEELAQAVRTKREEQVLHDITEAMTTNESFFFRDSKPFDQFRKVLLPELLRTRDSKKQFRIWSAAASSGQEAYSLAMICREEAARLQGWKVDILGTDLSNEMIERAKSGIYSQFEVQRGLPISLLMKYFSQIGTDKWQLNETIRSMVQYKPGNLLVEFGPVGTFDVIFCRNVLIYFDQQTKARVLEALSHVMAPDGVLFLGGAETVLGVSDKFKPLDTERGMYVLANRPETGMLSKGSSVVGVEVATRVPMAAVGGQIMTS
ncbi:MAG: protein-glutamate O-methyltransferase CheR [Proteobacteria bacterium]|jgi:chemotaxis protein methyltransferase CheR|nr:protein-glutamate O-methyltransferase CheR [Alphaproteobacteria bacterium]NCC03170.1 protein-glutamate O-methyltransferase CheR [Pseudomonadota bacterium]